MNPGRGETRCGGSGQLAEPPARDGGNWGGRPEAGPSCPGLSLPQSRWLPRSALAVTALRPLAHDPSLRRPCSGGPRPGAPISASTWSVLSAHPARGTWGAPLAPESDPLHSPWAPPYRGPRPAPPVFPKFVQRGPGFGTAGQRAPPRASQGPGWMPSPHPRSGATASGVGVSVRRVRTRLGRAAGRRGPGSPSLVSSAPRHLLTALFPCSAGTGL